MNLDYLLRIENIEFIQRTIKYIRNNLYIRSINQSNK